MGRPGPSGAFPVPREPPVLASLPFSEGPGVDATCWQSSGADGEVLCQLEVSPALVQPCWDISWMALPVVVPAPRRPPSPFASQGELVPTPLLQALTHPSCTFYNLVPNFALASGHLTKPALTLAPSHHDWCIFSAHWAAFLVVRGK